MWLFLSNFEFSFNIFPECLMKTMFSLDDSMLLLCSKNFFCNLVTLFFTLQIHPTSFFLSGFAIFSLSLHLFFNLHFSFSLMDKCILNKITQLNFIHSLFSRESILRGHTFLAFNFIKWMKLYY